LVKIALILTIKKLVSSGPFVLPSDSQLQSLVELRDSIGRCNPKILFQERDLFRPRPKWKGNIRIYIK